MIDVASPELVQHNPPLLLVSPKSNNLKHLAFSFLSQFGIGLLVLLVAVSMGLYFLGLTPSNPNLSATDRTQASTKSETIRIMGDWYGEGEKETFLRKFIQAYSSKTGIDVDMKFPREIIHESNTKKLATYIANAIRSNAVPFDIIIMNPTVYGYVSEELNDPNWGQQYLVDFSSIAGFTSSHTPELLQDDWFRKHTGNIFVGPFVGNEIQTLYVNSTIAGLIGIDIPTYDLTWDDFIDFVQAVSRYNKEYKTHIAVLGGSLNSVALDPIIHQLLLSQLDPDELENSSVTPTKLAVLRNTFNQVARLAPFASDLYLPDWQSQRSDDIHSRFLNNEIVFAAGPASLYNHWQSIDSESLTKIMPVQLPSMNTASSVYSGTYQPAWAVFKNSPHKDLAVQLLMQYTSEEAQHEWFRYTQTATMQKTSAPENLLSLSNQFGKFNFELSKRYGTSLRLYPSYSFIIGESNIHFASSLTSFFQDVALGIKNPNQAFEQIQRQLTK